MIVRIVLVIFASGAAGISYLAGLTRLVSSLLVGFGALISFFFGILFVVPAEQRELWFPVHGQVTAWPFFLLAVVLAVMVGLFFIKKSERKENEEISSLHLQYFVAAFFGYLLSVFLPSLLWFPSDALRLSSDAATLGLYVLIGTCLYLIGTSLSLYLFYRASKGATPQYPDLMRRAVPALFALFQFDKMPAFVAFLLIYSPETQIIYPSLAALALAGYIPVSLFLLTLSRESE